VYTLKEVDSITQGGPAAAAADTLPQMHLLSTHKLDVNMPVTNRCTHKHAHIHTTIKLHLQKKD
jgi:hypothetical protein